MGAIFWAILTSVFALLEIIIPGLVTIWLALAALVVTALAGFINNSYIEAFIFSVLSLIFILFTRPVLQNYLKKRRKNDFSSAMTGSEIKIEKLEKDIEKTQKELDKVLGKLSNEAFLAKAPQSVVDKENAIKEELETKIAKFRESINLYK